MPIFPILVILKTEIEIENGILDLNSGLWLSYNAPIPIFMEVSIASKFDLSDIACSVCKMILSSRQKRGRKMESTHRRACKRQF